MLTSDSLDRRIKKLHVRSQLAKRPVSGCGLVEAGGYRFKCRQIQFHCAMNVRMSLASACKLCAESKQKTVRSQLKDENGCLHKHCRQQFYSEGARCLQFMKSRTAARLPKLQR